MTAQIRKGKEKYRKRERELFIQSRNRKPWSKNVFRADKVPRRLRKSEREHSSFQQRGGYLDPRIFPRRVWVGPLVFGVRDGRTDRPAKFASLAKARRAWEGREQRDSVTTKKRNTICGSNGAEKVTECITMHFDCIRGRNIFYISGWWIRAFVIIQ